MLRVRLLLGFALTSLFGVGCACNDTCTPPPDEPQIGDAGDDGGAGWLDPSDAGPQDTLPGPTADAGAPPNGGGNGGPGSADAGVREIAGGGPIPPGGGGDHGSNDGDDGVDEGPGSSGHDGEGGGGGEELTPPVDGVAYGCTYTQGYWRNHTDAWPLSSLTLGSASYTADEALAILTTPVRGDASLDLAHQLIAALLSVAGGASPVASIDDAQAWLTANGARLPFGIPSADAPDAIALAEALTAYNEGLAGPPHCGDEAAWYGCTYSQGYWRTHPDAWPLSSLTLGSESYTADEALAILTTPVYGDASLDLAHQLIAALLNAATASPIDAIADAQAWLTANGTRLAFGIPSADAPDAIALVEALTAYNEGLAGPPHCHDDLDVSDNPR